MDTPTPADEAATSQLPIPSSQESGGMRGALDALLAGVVLALAFLLASFPARNADVWSNLAVGRLVATGQYPFGSDPFSSLDPAPPWVNPAWLYGLLLYGLHEAAGGPALVVVKAVLVMVLAGVLLAIRRPGRGWLPAVAVALALLAISPRLFLQPAVVSFLFLAVLLYLLHFPPRRPAGRGLPIAVGVLFLLWANLDGGFVYGLLLLALWLLGAVLQRAIPLGDKSEIRNPKSESDGSDFELRISDLGFALVVAVGACVLNPYHVRVFQVPSELLPWTLPAEARSDGYIRQFMRGPFERGYFEQVEGAAAQAGKVPAAAYYLLLGLGLGSFAANAGGWRWGRALTWLAFALLSTLSARLVPYFAVVGAAVLVLNLQAVAIRRADQPSEITARAAFTRAYLAGAGRVLTLLVLGALCAFVWPGLLAGDAGAHQPQRRVGWRLEPDATLERAARQLAAWYNSGRLRAGEARGFHLQPELALVCAWFCPQEKGLFDPRMAAPAQATIDYARLRRSVLDVQLQGQSAGDGPPAPPPQALLREYGITHLALTGLRTQPLPFLAMTLWRDPEQYPLWAITGRGMIAGWNDPQRPGAERYPDLRLDPARLAFGAGAEPVPSAQDVAAPREPTAWERYRQGPAPVPVEAVEAALWLAYRDTLPQRADLAAQLWQNVAALGRAAPAGVPAAWGQLLEYSPAARAAPQVARNETFRRLPGMVGLDAAPVLGVRAARRAVLANPDDYEGYLRLGQAYGVLISDRELARVQQIAAYRGALERLRGAGPWVGRPTAADEFLAWQGLFAQYLPPPGPRQRPEEVIQGASDLALEALERMVALFPRYVGEARAMPEEQAQAQHKGMTEQLQAMREAVRRRSDRYETAAARTTAAQRAQVAMQFGLVREALTVLQNAPGGDLKVEDVLLLLDLELGCGHAVAARELLLSKELYPVTQIRPPTLQPQFRRLIVLACAAVGDYDRADGELAAAETLSGRAAERFVPDTAAQLVAFLVAPDLQGAPPLTRVYRMPFWAGAVQRAAAIQGDVVGNHLWHGLLALEAGNLPLARRQFRLAQPHELARFYGDLLGQ